MATSQNLQDAFAGESQCPGRIFSSVRQRGDMMVSHAIASGSRDANRPIRGER